MKRTKFDDRFDSTLIIFRDALFVINQKAVLTDQDDIKSQSCYIIEVIDTILSNRGVLYE